MVVINAVSERPSLMMLLAAVMMMMMMITIGDLRLLAARGRKF